MGAGFHVAALVGVGWEEQRAATSGHHEKHRDVRGFCDLNSDMLWYPFALLRRDPRIQIVELPVLPRLGRPAREQPPGEHYYGRCPVSVHEFSNHVDKDPPIIQLPRRAENGPSVWDNAVYSSIGLQRHSAGNNGASRDFRTGSAADLLATCAVQFMGVGPRESRDRRHGSSRADY